MRDTTRKLASSAAALGLTVLHNRRTITTVSALALAAVALVGCSAADTDVPAGGDTATTQSGGTGSSSSTGDASGDEPIEVEVEDVTVYTYDDHRVVGDGDLEPYVVDTVVPVVFELPDDLRAAVPEDKTLAVDGFTVDATAFSTGVCRLDVEVDWADGGYEALASPSQIQPDLGEAANAIGHVTSNLTYEPVVVDELPADEEVEVGATYVKNDGTAFTHVDECSEDYADDLIQLLFSYDEPVVETGSAQILTSDIAVVPGGQGGAEGATLVIDSDVYASLSATGDWTRSS